MRLSICARVRMLRMRILGTRVHLGIPGGPSWETPIGEAVGHPLGDPFGNPLGYPPVVPVRGTPGRSMGGPMLKNSSLICATTIFGVWGELLRNSNLGKILPKPRKLLFRILNCFLSFGNDPAMDRHT